MTLPKHAITRTTRFTRLTIGIGLAIALIAGASPSMAQLNMNADQIKQRIESDYGVTVLRVEEVSDQERSAFAVTTMKSGGDYDDAYQVNTVVADPETGGLIRQYRHTANGMRFAAPSVDLRTSPRLATTR